MLEQIPVVIVTPDSEYDPEVVIVELDTDEPEVTVPALSDEEYELPIHFELLFFFMIIELTSSFFY